MRLLVVEDDRLLNNTLCYNLSAAGYTVDAAMSKSAAVNFCEAQDYDLIVLDVNLPDGNGFDFCTEIKERRPDTAVIFLTANDMESDKFSSASHSFSRSICRVRTICGFLTSTFSKRYSIGVKITGSPARVAVNSEKLTLGG